MIQWKVEVQGDYITEHATDGDYLFEVVAPYKKQPCKWAAYYQKKGIGAGTADSMERARFFALACKADHIHGLTPYPD